MATAKKRILILGAGFGGLAAAVELARSTPKCIITLIDRNAFQLFTPDLYEIATAASNLRSHRRLKKMVCVDVRTALTPYNIRFVQEEVTHITTKKHTVKTDKRTHTYDYLLIALGSEPYYFNIPGMQKHSMPFKWIDDAVRIRACIALCLKKRRQARVMICGAGPAGVELAAELANAHRHEALRITLVEGRDRILASLPPRAQRIAAQRLMRLGVIIKTEWMIAKAEAGAITSRTNETLTSDCIVWTGGVQASRMLKYSDVALTPSGQIPVRITTQSKQDRRVFAIGDAAELTQHNTTAPQTAHEAVHQGSCAAHNLLRATKRKPLKPYRFASEGFVVTLGGKFGIVVLPGGVVLSGAVAWFVRKFVDFRHFRSVLPFMHACKQWYSGFREMNKND